MGSETTCSLCGNGCAVGASTAALLTLTARRVNQAMTRVAQATRKVAPATPIEVQSDVDIPPEAATWPTANTAIDHPIPEEAKSAPLAPVR